MLPARHVRLGTVDGCMTILDLRRGEYVLLDPVSSAMWAGLTRSGASPGAVLDDLQRQFDVEPARLRADLDTFVTRCVAEGLLDAGTDDAFEAPKRRPLRPVYSPTIAAWGWLLGVRRKLRRRGFAKAYGDVVGAAPDVLAGAEEGALLRAERAFTRAEFLLPTKDASLDCLPRSLALFGFLRSMGLPAEHRIGVARRPFSAHAWVECNGRVILDLDHRASLTMLSEFRP